MINREIKTGKPIRVYYELTDFGLGIYELLIPMLSFFSHNVKKYQKN
jgi:DNA-binding HxlR family transcriptional regulator